MQVYTVCFGARHIRVKASSFEYDAAYSTALFRDEGLMPLATFQNVTAVYAASVIETPSKKVGDYPIKNFNIAWPK